MAGEYRDERGTYVWRTVGGHRIKIYTGQTLSEAMKESGKFGKKKNEEKDYSKETDKKKRLENVYMMDRVLRGMNNEEALDDGWLMNAVADEDTDRGLEQFIKDNDWGNGDYGYYASDEGYNDIVKMYKRRAKEYAKDGVMSRAFYDADRKAGRNNWKELAGLDEKELAFLSKDVPEFEVYGAKGTTTYKANKDLDKLSLNDRELSKLNVAGGKKYSFEEDPEFVQSVTSDLYGRPLLSVDDRDKDYAQKLYDDEIKESKRLEGILNQSQIEAGNRLNKKAENGVRTDIKAFLSGKEDYDGSQESFIKDLSDEWGVDRNRVEDILHEENSKHPRLFKTDRQPQIKTITQEEYDKMPNDYKGTLKDLVDTAEFRGENKDQLRKEYEAMGYDVDNDKTIMEYPSTLKPVKIANKKTRKDAFDFTQEEVNKGYDGMREKMQSYMDANVDKWSASNYTNAEFLAHLEDANWHSELHQLEDAGLSEKELEYIKKNTTLSSWGVGSELTGKENVQKMIDEAKAKFRGGTSKASGKTFPRNMSKEIYEMDVDKGNAWSGNAVQKTANGEKFVSVRRNGPSQNSAEDIVREMTQRHPQLKAQISNNGDEIRFTLKDDTTNKEIEKTIKGMNDKELYDVSKGWAVIIGTNEDDKTQKDIRKIAREEIKNRKNRIPKGYADERLENANLQNRYAGTIKYLQENTDMDLEEILELLKKRGK